MMSGLNMIMGLGRGGGAACVGVAAQASGELTGGVAVRVCAWETREEQERARRPCSRCQQQMLAGFGFLRGAPGLAAGPTTSSGMARPAHGVLALSLFFFGGGGEGHGLPLVPPC